MLTDIEILQLYQNEYVPERKTKHDLANDLGLTYGQVDHAFRRAKKEEEKKKVAKDGQSNQVVLSTKDDISIDELLARHDLDPEDWVVTKSVVNKWEVARKDIDKDIHWVEDGKIGADSYVRDMGEMNKTNLFQLKVWLARKEPIEFNISVKPVQVTLPSPKIGKVEKSTYDYDLAIFDPHFGFLRNFRTGNLTPFHDRKALASVLLLAKHLPLSRTYWGGDLLDLADWTDKFARSPEMYGVTQPAIYECSWWIENFSFYCEEQILLEGNHDIRMQKALEAHMAYAYDLRPVDGMVASDFPVMSIPNLLSLESRGIEWHGNYPDNAVWVTPDLALEHGKIATNVPGGTARGVIKDRTYSTLFGHVHRHEIVTDFISEYDEGKTIFSMCPGAVCRMDGVVPGSTTKSNWNQGVAVIVRKGDELINVIHCPIENGKLFYNDLVFDGSDFDDNEIESAENVGFF